MIELKINNSENIHSTAIVHESVKFGSNVVVGPFSIIEPGVSIGDRTVIGNNVTICEGTTIGEECKIYHSASIGEVPQDLKFKGEKTEAFVGDRTIIREYVTINRGTEALGKTEVGSDCLLMASCHVAHDCIVGDNVILANLSTLGGHVTIGDWATLGGAVIVHQFCNIGSHSFLGGGVKVVQDVPPFILGAGHPIKYEGINSIGLKRRNFSIEDRKTIKEIYKLYFRSGFSRTKALDEIEAGFDHSLYKEQIIKFIRSSKRGII